MTIIQGWKDSVSLCKLAALKLMFLATLNAMKEVLRVLCVAWFLIPASLLVLASLYFKQLGLTSLAHTLISTCMLLAVRPSIRIKNGAYFREYAILYVKYLSMASLLALGFLCIVLVIWQLWVIFLFLIGYISEYPTPNFSLLMHGDVDFLVAMPLLIFSLPIGLFGLLGVTDYTIFFYFDRAGSVWQSFKKSMRLVIYNLPMLLVYFSIAICFKVIYWILIAVIVGSPCCMSTSLNVACVGVRYSLLGLLPYLFSLCLFVNIYTKRVHDQYSLYQ